MNFVCPRCKGELTFEAPDQLRCQKEALTFRQMDGIWRFLLPERESYYSLFIEEYEKVRHFEGRFSADVAYYRALPFKDLSGRFSSDWKIRAKSFEVLSKLLQTPSKIIDLGAGNGWLSNRLTEFGHEVFAIDLLTNSEDGLGAWRYYETKFASLQAEFSFLPFSTAVADVLIFNASLHYAENYNQVLTEGLRVLKPDGVLIVMDSPIYHDGASGREMLAERKMQFQTRYGFSSDSLQSEGFLTYHRMEELGKSLGVYWKHIIPNYGWKWLLRPFWARLRGKREPAQFGLWVGKR